MRRSALLSAATATALAASMFTGSTLARADATPGGGPVRDAADTWYGYPGMVFITAHSDSPITHITAHFTPVGAQDSAPEAGSTDDFTQQSGTDGRSAVWRAPVHLAELGEYRISVDLQDSSGATVTGAVSQWTLNYQTILTIPDLTVTPARPDYFHQTVTVSGTELAEDPRTPDAPVPVPNASVSFTSQGTSPNGRFNTQTGADGHFTFSFVPTVYWADMTAYPDTSSAYPGAVLLASAAQHMNPVQAPSRFTASTHALNLRQGTTGTVTGRAEIETADGWQPLPHTPLSLLGTGTSQGLGATTTTDGNGYYALRASSENPLPTSQLVLGGTPFLQLATQPFSLHMGYTTVLTMDATLGDDSRLHVSGEMLYRDPRAHWPSNTAVSIEYSKDGKTGWKSASTIPVEIHYNKPNFPEDFSAAFTAPNNAYWRAHFSGNPDLASSTTKPVHLRRYPARITGFDVSPEPVRKNSQIHLKGTLQYYTGTAWKPLTHAAPALYFRPHGASAYRYIADLDTDSKGRVRNIILDGTQDGTWAVALNRTIGGQYLKSPLVTDYVDVR